MFPDSIDSPRLPPAPAGAMQRDNIDPVQIRFPVLPQDWDKGNYPRTVIRPAYARYLLNRMGGAHLNVTAEAVKTPWPGPQGKGIKTWLNASPPRVNQHYKFGLSTTTIPGPHDVLAMETYQKTWTSVRARLSEIVKSINGG